jgi:hypothetical protein
MAQDRPPTMDEIRRAIDNGEIDDSVNFPNPAALPLGTADEAAARPQAGRVESEPRCPLEQRSN